METDRILYVDAQSGISGDMMIGALLDLGCGLDLLEKGLRLVQLHGYRISTRMVTRAGVHARKFDVTIEDETAVPHNHHVGQHERHHHRSFGEIRKMIECSTLSGWVKTKSIEAFTKLAEAEGKVHAQPASEVHFHEIGATDSIVDILGCMILLESLMPVRVLCSAVNVGQGTLECRHGTYPVPAPAVEELLRGVPTFSDSVQGEMTTPTGAALLTVLVESYQPRPLMKTRACGYGAGSRDMPGKANILRLTLADRVTVSRPEGAGQVAVLEATIDDMNPQIWGHFQERALAAGALDVYAVPAQMKKNRPAILLTLVCGAEVVDEMARLVFTETTTIGLRYTFAYRKTLERLLEQVETEYGPVAVKVALLEGRRVNFVPEYEDCRRLADRAGVPLKEVIAAANRAFLNTRGSLFTGTG